MNLIIPRYILIKESKEILDRMTFIHNGAFLNYKDNIAERDDGLSLLKKAVEMLGAALEKYEMKEITTGEMHKAYVICTDRYKKIIMLYPWLNTFDLHTGYAFNYHKFSKDIKKKKLK